MSTSDDHATAYSPGMALFWPTPSGLPRSGSFAALAMGDFLALGRDQILLTAEMFDILPEYVAGPVVAIIDGKGRIKESPYICLHGLGANGERR